MKTKKVFVLSWIKIVTSYIIVDFQVRVLTPTPVTQAKCPHHSDDDFYFPPTNRNTLLYIHGGQWIYLDKSWTYLW